MEAWRLWTALSLALLTSATVVARRILILNRFRCPPPSMHVVALGMGLLTGATFFVTLNAIRGAILLQLFAGLTSTALGWSYQVLVVNGDFRFPTRQQLLSLAGYAFQETAILMQARLLLNGSA